ncbi:MAG TPA: DUF1572 family protein [Gemmatimonadaceae bacterium]|nr:DUF1572 family protein [Gemmatimonadaceae bacterium]
MTDDTPLDASALAAHFLADARLTFAKYKALAEGAMAQMSDDALFVAPDDGESNSVAIVVRHLAGNMRSRWTDFLTTDGEKPGRDRDSEFEPYDPSRATRTALLEDWESGWRALFDALDGLEPGDLGRTVQIRGEPHSVTQALTRQIAHYAYHVGQIVYVAKMLRAGDWKTLSIARRASRRFNEELGHRP